MLIPIFGELVSSAGLALNVYFKDLPMEAAGITEALFEGITGKIRLVEGIDSNSKFSRWLGNNANGCI